MSVRVLVSREFSCVTVAEAVSQFKSLQDAGWSVLVDAAATNGDQPQAKAAPRLSRSGAGSVISEIIHGSKIDVATVADVVGVSEQSVRNWLRGVNLPCKKSWSRIKSLHEGVAKHGAKHLTERSLHRRKRAARSLSQEDMLDIGIRLASGETITGVAGLYEITRHRVKEIAKRVGA